MSQFHKPVRKKPRLKKQKPVKTGSNHATMQGSRCGSFAATQTQLRNWYGRFPGVWLQEQELTLLETVLADLFGYHILQIGLHKGQECLKVSRIPHQMIMDVDFPRPSAPCDEENLDEKPRENVVTDYINGEPEYIPLAGDSLDVLILSHTLEFCANPHEVLREADRILIPEGNVIILGFNPWGLWMPWRLLLSWRKKAPWCGRFISLARLKDWLKLLGFDITESRRFFFRPPLSHPGLMKRLQFLDKWGRRLWPFLGGAYFLVAKKRVATLTPIKPRWRPRRSRLVTTGLAGNSTTTTLSNRAND
jgi:SAM-dependent methyltransferase